MNNIMSNLVKWLRLYETAEKIHECNEASGTVLRRQKVSMLNSDHVRVMNCIKIHEQYVLREVLTF